MQMTPIQWTWSHREDGTLIPNSGSTWNPAIGCRRVSAGCENCYAERLIAVRLSKNPKLPMYHDIARLTEGGKPQFTGNRKLLPDRLDEPLRARKGRKIFVCNMGDLFFEGHPFEDIAAVFGVMAAAQQHTFQALTKRPERALEFMQWLGGHPHEKCAGELCHRGFETHSPNGQRDRLENMGAGWPWPLPNVWIGVSVENQAEADKRIPLLLRIPAALRFLSCEPLLENVLLDDGVTSWLSCHGETAEECCGSVAETGKHFRGVEWVICGGESGPNARPFDLAHARSLRDQCRAAGVLFFMKQFGAQPRGLPACSSCEGEQFDGTRCPRCGDVVQADDEGRRVLHLRDKHGGTMDEWPEDLRIREVPHATT